MYVHVPRLMCECFVYLTGMWAVVNKPDGTRHGNGYDKDADVYMHNPMEDPMPYAPSLKMFCVYGVDKPVERCDRCLWYECVSQVAYSGTPEICAVERGGITHSVEGMNL